MRLIRTLALVGAIGVFASAAFAIPLTPHDFDTSCTNFSTGAGCVTTDPPTANIGTSFQIFVNSLNAPFTSPAPGSAPLPYSTASLFLAAGQQWTLQIGDGLFPAFQDVNNLDPLDSSVGPDSLTVLSGVASGGVLGLVDCTGSGAYFCSADTASNTPDTLTPQSYNQFIEIDVHVGANPNDGGRGWAQVLGGDCTPDPMNPGVGTNCPGPYDGGSPAGTWHFGIGIMELGVAGVDPTIVVTTSVAGYNSAFNVNGTVGLGAGGEGTQNVTFTFLDSAFTPDGTVPEPATLALLGSGLLGLARRFRRK